MKKSPSPRVRRIRKACKHPAQLKFGFVAELQRDKGSVNKQPTKN
jgi:hypothetical protein